MADHAANRSTLGIAYGLIAELLLHPDDRDPAILAGAPDLLDTMSSGLATPLAAFLADAGGASADEYVQTVELSPPCPLYLGAHLFDDPTSCRDVGATERNGYMLELLAVFRHFGFELSGRELPDFLPIVVEFLQISLAYPDRDAIGLRRRLVEHYVQPALAPLRQGLERLSTPYAHLVVALEAAVTMDRALMEDMPAWMPPRRTHGGARSLPVLTGRRAQPRPMEESTL